MGRLMNKFYACLNHAERRTWMQLPWRVFQWTRSSSFQPQVGQHAYILLPSMRLHLQCYMKPHIQPCLRRCSAIHVRDKFVEILLLNCPNIIKIEQMLKLSGKQVAIINDVHLCLYGTRFISFAAGPDVTLFLPTCRRSKQLCSSSAPSVSTSYACQRRCVLLER